MTATQLELDLREITIPSYEPEATLAEKFQAFHEQNPHVADAFEALAAQWLSRHQRVGMKALAEALRWRSGIETVGEPWRINNNHVAFYARLLLARRPEWTGRIQTRTACADSG